MSTLGPYCGDGTKSFRSTEPSSHARWTEDGELPYTSIGFEGGSAGRKSREKEKRRMMNRDEESRVGDDEWFPGLRQMSGKSTRNRSTGDRIRSPLRHSLFDVGSKRDHLPFSHSHLMANVPASTPIKGISFGKLTPPSGSSTKIKSRYPVNPELAAFDRISRQSSDSSSLLGPASTSTSKAKKRRRREGTERDWEREWRSSGKGGGPVSEWGKEMDREEKKVRKKATGIDGRSHPMGITGQRYTGGY